MTSCAIGFSKNLNRLGTTYGSLVLDNQATGLNACGNLNITLPANPTIGQTIAVNNVCGGKVALTQVPVAVPVVNPVVGNTNLGLTMPNCFCMTKDGKLLFVSGSGVGQGIYVYSRNPTTGILTNIGLLPTGHGVFVGMSNDQRFLYHIYINFSPVPLGGPHLQTYSINHTTGALTLVSDSIYSNLAGNTSKFSDYGYMVAGSAVGVSSFKLDPVTGIPSFNSSVNYGQAEWLAGGGSSLFFYAIHTAVSAAPPGIRVIELNPSTGALSEKTALFMPLSAGIISYPTISADGNFLYLSHTTQQTFSLYSINKINGALSFISTNSVAPNSMYFFVFDPSGNYAYIPSFNPNPIVAIFSANKNTGAVIQSGSISIALGSTIALVSNDGLDLYLGATGFVYTIRLANVVNKTVNLFKSILLQSNGTTWTISNPPNSGFLNFSIG